MKLDSQQRSGMFGIIYVVSFSVLLFVDLSDRSALRIATVTILSGIGLFINLAIGEIIDKVNIDELKPLLDNHPILQLIEK